MLLLCTKRSTNQDNNDRFKRMFIYIYLFIIYVFIYNETSEAITATGDLKVHVYDTTVSS